MWFSGIYAYFYAIPSTPKPGEAFVLSMDLDSSL
jgi:hypothetical protein